MRTDLTAFDTPLTFVRRFAHDIERLFENTPLARITAPTDTAVDWLPSVDIVEKNGTLFIRVDLPGLTAKDVSIDATTERITVKGERKTDIEETKDGVYRKERTYGTFFRSIPLPEGVKPDDITATFANGVLELTMPLPKANVTAPKRIEVRTAGEKVKAA